MANKEQGAPKDEDEPFLTRWSRLKRRPPDQGKAESAEPTAEQARSEPTAPASSREPEAPKATTAARPDLASLPSIEELTAESDFTRFMDARVPSGLRHEALRKAWSVDPLIRDFIEVAENQYDWNAPDGVPGFGPLKAGTDVAALLSRVIGSESGPLPGAQRPISAPHDNLSQGAVHSARNEDSAPPQISGAPDSGEAAGGGAEQQIAEGAQPVAPLGETQHRPSAETAEQTDPHERDRGPPRSRRRHGGALPT